MLPRRGHVSFKPSFFFFLFCFCFFFVFFFFSSRRRHTRCSRDWSSDVCSSDLQLRKNVFSFASTRLSGSTAADATTLNVYTTTGFDPVPHGTSYAYLPSTSVIMLRIKYQDSWEICSATGKTATSFTGVVRGIFGTRSEERRVGKECRSRWSPDHQKKKKKIN